MPFQTLALLLATVQAQQPVGLPRGPAPQVVVATYGNDPSDGTPFLEIVTTEFMGRERTVAVPGQAKRIETVLSPVQMTTRYPLNDKVMAVYGTDGKKIDLKDVPKLLTRPSPVLASADGKEVDPFYLRLAREGTLVLVSPYLVRNRLREPARNPPVRLP